MMACDDGHIDGMAGGSDAGGEDAVGADGGVLGVRVILMVVGVQEQNHLTHTPPPPTSLRTVGGC